MIRNTLAIARKDLRIILKDKGALAIFFLMPLLLATMMGLAFMSLFIANNLIGWIGGFYEKISPAEFWTMHAAIAAAGGLLVMLFGRPLSQALKGGAGQPLRPSAMTLEVER